MTARHPAETARPGKTIDGVASARAGVIGSAGMAWRLPAFMPPMPALVRAVAGGRIAVGK